MYSRMRKYVALSTGSMVSHLPGFGQVGVASALQCGYHVTIWTYGRLKGVPFGHGPVDVRDAACLIPLKQARALLSRNLRLQHLADVVRLLAIKEHHTNFGRAMCWHVRT